MLKLFFLFVLIIPFVSKSQIDKEFEILLSSFIIRKTKLKKDKISIFYDQKNNFFLDSNYQSDKKNYFINPIISDTPYFFNRNWDNTSLMNYIKSNVLNNSCFLSFDEGLIVLVSCPYENWSRFYLNSLICKGSVLIINLDFYENIKNKISYKSYQVELMIIKNKLVLRKNRIITRKKIICR
jgi:hypothetical protein